VHYNLLKIKKKTSITNI